MILLKLWSARGINGWSVSSNLLRNTLIPFLVFFHFFSLRLIKTLSSPFYISFSSLSALFFYIYFNLFSSIYFFLSDFWSSATLSTIFDFWLSMTLFNLSFYNLNFFISCSSPCNYLPAFSLSWTVKTKWSRFDFKMPITSLFGYFSSDFLISVKIASGLKFFFMYVWERALM